MQSLGSAVSIEVEAGARLSGLWHRPDAASACLVLAHGAGAGMRHAFLETIARGLSTQGIATLRFQFPYMERGDRRPDPPAVCHQSVRAAVELAGRLAPTLPRFAGGKSFGGRMTSQTQALAPLADVRGLAFLGFPLHPPGRPADERGKHLLDVQIPMLFLQGTRDQFAELNLLQPLIEKLGPRATLRLFTDADHSYHVPARARTNDAEVTAAVVQALVEWMQRCASS